jgi:hypothetical protein
MHRAKTSFIRKEYGKSIYKIESRGSILGVATPGLLIAAKLTLGGTNVAYGMLVGALVR